MASVFVSYSHIDNEYAEQVTNVLKRLGIEHFCDKKDIELGHHITDSVNLGIRKANGILVIISSASLKSHWVPYEIGHACALGKVVLPYLVQPTLDVPLYISNLKCARSLEEIRNYFSDTSGFEVFVKAAVQAEIESVVRHLTGASTYALLELEYHGGALHHDRISQALGRLYEDAHYLQNGAAKVATSLLVALDVARDSGSGMVELTERGRALANSKELKTKNKSAVERFERSHAER